MVINLHINSILSSINYNFSVITQLHNHDIKNIIMMFFGKWHYLSNFLLLFLFFFLILSCIENVYLEAGRSSLFSGPIFGICHLHVWFYHTISFSLSSLLLGLRTQYPKIWFLGMLICLCKFYFQAQSGTPRGLRKPSFLTPHIFCGYPLPLR